MRDPVPPSNARKDLLAAAGDDVAGAAAVRRAGFTRLRSGTAVSQSTIAADTGLSSTAVAHALAELVATGSVNLDAWQRVVAVSGLSVVPAAHELFLDGATFGTWCAFDAVGIPAALGLDTVARSRCGHCTEPIEVILTLGTPPSNSPVVGWLPGNTCANVQTDFCPARQPRRCSETQSNGTSEGALEREACLNSIAAGAHCHRLLHRRRHRAGVACVTVGAALWRPRRRLPQRSGSSPSGQDAARATFGASASTLQASSSKAASKA
jgi:hypothetical protein